MLSPHHGCQVTCSAGCTGLGLQLQCKGSHLAPNVEPQDVVGWKLRSQRQWKPAWTCIRACPSSQLPVRQAVREHAVSEHLYKLEVAGKLDLCSSMYYSTLIMIDQDMINRNNQCRMGCVRRQAATCAGSPADDEPH